MSDIAIRCENVGKKYCKSLRRSVVYGGLDILRSAMGTVPVPGTLRPDEFWALDKIDLGLKKGESFGIIGPNGSGKTTLLKLLNGIFMPDRGQITVEGKVGALIQVGAGFHPMLSGRENIYINGAILGMTKKELDQKFDTIVEFADIGDFLDSPVKFYSSGMYVRLGFSIAIHSEPEILLIDEILAVGDKEFQIKCYQKMHEIKKRGTTIVLVSHNEYAIRENTSRCLYLDHGNQRFIGPSDEAIGLYIKETYEHRLESRKNKSLKLNNGNRPVDIKGFKFLNSRGEEVNFVETGALLNMAIELNVHEKIEHPIIGVNFYDDEGLVYAANSDYEQVNIKEFLPGTRTVEVRIPEFHLPTGDYLCSVVVAREQATNLIDWHDMSYKIVVGRAPNARGLLKLTTQWKF